MKALLGPGIWGTSGQGYEKRYGPERYEEELKKAVNKNWCNVADIIDHCFQFVTDVFRGTSRETTCCVYHDGLKQWYANDAQDHMRLKWPDLYKRQIRCMGQTNINDKDYRGRVVGDSPEFARALDAHGFSRLEVSIDWHVALSSLLPNYEDPRYFRLGTMKQVWQTMKRCWEVEPTPESIVQDIQGLPRVVDKIVLARGVLVDDGTLRGGRRALSHFGNKLLKTRKTASQRKATLKQRPVHGDLQFVLDTMITSDSGLANFAHALNAMNEAHNAADLQEIVDDVAEEAEGGN